MCLLVKSKQSFLIVIMLMGSVYSDSAYVNDYDEEDGPMDGLECYQCIEHGPELPGKMNCTIFQNTAKLEMDLEVFGDELMEEGFQFVDDDDEDDDQVKLDRIIKKALNLDNANSNPCKLMTRNVMEVVQIKDNQLIPLYLNLEGKAFKDKYEALTSVISSIKFFKRRNSSIMTVEVQLRTEDDDMFSFVIPDLTGRDFLNIRDNTLFYTAL